MDLPPLPDSGRVDAGVDAGSEPMCDNLERDGDETGVDCGGSCPPCPSGDPCRAPEDCESMVCDRSRCLVPNCTDGVRNGDETGTDCGGDCGLCPGGEPCTSNDQCLSGRCRASTCTMSDCEDGIMNADETDVDCGGPLCRPCGGGADCVVNEDCDSFICAAGSCTDAACNDAVQNQDETSVDCGGSACPPCRDGLACIIDSDCEGRRCLDGGCVSCTDGAQNAEETDIDCGGGLCDPCVDGQMCTVGGDCAGRACEAGLCVSCSDGVLNQDETDIDCGGTACPGCADGLVCTGNTDCINRTCESGTCVSCLDRVQNQDESDVDCGGTACPGCAAGLICTGASDCASMICDGPTMRCNAPGCGDGVLNGAETDLDCGGGACLGCADGLSCIVGTDCLNGVCTGGVCQPPTCADGVANGLETDIDCGGTSTCPRCMDGRLCPNGPSDCLSPLCTSGRCGDVRGHLVLIGHDYFSRNAGADRVLGNSALLAPETGALDILIYDEFADRTASGEVANVEAAITSVLTAEGRTGTFRRLTSSGNLTTALTPATDVLIIAEQESGFSASFPTIATSWEPTLRSFLAGGGVVIVTTFFDNGWQLVDRPMLVDIGGTGSYSGSCVVDAGATTHPIASMVTTYSPPNGSRTWTGVTTGGAISVTPIVVDSVLRPFVLDALF